MEGDECYKLSTIKAYLAATGGKPIRTILEVGVNVGTVTLLLHEYFPDAQIYGFEVVPQWFDVAQKAVAGISNITLYNVAMSSQHLFADDIGQQPRAADAALRILKGKPAGGPGWVGGSIVVPEGHPSLTDPATYKFL